MDQNDVHLAMKRILQHELTLVTIQGFEILNRIDMRRFGQAEELSHALVERAQFIAHLLARFARVEDYEIPTRKKEN